MYGYVRVSSINQNGDRRLISAAKGFKFSRPKIAVSGYFGKHIKRRQAKSYITTLEPKKANAPTYKGTFAKH